jgi:hypothetical protein
MSAIAGCRKSRHLPAERRDRDFYLCEKFERMVYHDNCVGFEGLILQIPADRHRCHYVKAKVTVHRYPDGTLGYFMGRADWHAIRPRGCCWRSNRRPRKSASRNPARRAAAG